MSNLTQLKKPPLIFYPIILAISPQLAIYIKNLPFVQISEIPIGLLLAMISLGFLWWLFSKITNSHLIGGLVVSIFFILFFSYGNLLPTFINLNMRYVQSDLLAQLFNPTKPKMIFVLIIWLTLFFAIFYFIIRIRSNFHMVTRFMNATSIIFLLIIAFQSTRILQQKLALLQGDYSINNELSSTIIADYDEDITSQNNDFPNIYYIILDGYGGNEVLRSYYDYDNQELYSFLQSEGFYIATNSRANYIQTFLSLSSSLNMRYLDDVAVQMGRDSSNPIPVFQLLRLNHLMDFLTSKGYTTIAFQTGYPATELQNADYFYSDVFTFTPYQHKIINLTPLRIWLNDYQYGTHRQNILNTFNQLPKVVQSDQPAFIFAHIFAPHPPFVFGQNGEGINPDSNFTLIDGNQITDFDGRKEYTQKYRDQLIFINKKLRGAVQEILSKQGEKSIIIIQGDHGPRSMVDFNSIENTNLHETFPILNTYYFPDQNYSNLYPEITPVNTFRVILDQYLGTNMGLLEERSYFSTIHAPYDFIDVTDQIND